MEHDQIQDLVIAKNEQVGAWVGVSKSSLEREGIAYGAAIFVPGSVHDDYVELLSASAVMYQNITAVMVSLAAMKEVILQHDGNEKTSALIASRIDEMTDAMLNVQIMAQVGPEKIGKSIVRNGDKK